MIWRGQAGSDEGPEQEAPVQGAGTSAEGPRDDSVGSAGASIGEHVETVLDAAELAARDIRMDAEEWARSYVEDSRRRADQLAADRIREISTLTDNLVARARAVAQQSDELITALEEAGRKVIGSAGSQPQVSEAVEAPAPADEEQAAEPPPAVLRPEPPSLPEPPAPPPAPEPPAAPEPPVPAEPPKPASSPGFVSEGARLLATQMAVAGSSREDVARRLREEFGIEDSTAILDEIGI